ncbi:class I SAM-dependent methyltransferase [Brevundimonas sp. VNH65]|uniref:class I SAM-dependent methyltransferase n=1 Tax=Brevundimonas sp. VNH65 TaxID=3400917 RepID=UPI003C089E96
MTTDDLEGLSWYAGSNLAGDGHLKRIPRWKRHFKGYTDRTADVLDIGCGAGASAIFFANYLPHALITCVDDQDDAAWEVFRGNLGEVHAGIRREQGGPLGKLEQLLQADRKFDIIHIDRVRNRDYAIAVGLMAWKVLRFGGIIVWSEYQWGEGRPSDKRPHEAINLVLALKEAEARVLWTGSQCVVRKSRQTTDG